MEEKYYQYADKQNQIRRTNRFLVVGYLVFYAFVLLVVWASCLWGLRSVGFSVLTTVVAAAAALFPILLQRAKPDSLKLRYVTLIGLYAVTFLVTFAYTQSFIRFLGLAPIIGCILFFDRKYAAVSLIGYVLINILTMIGQARQGGTVGLGEEIFNLTALLALSLIIYRTTDIAQRFNHDTRHSEQQEQRKQKAILDDVINVASEVRKGTESAMQLVSDLNSSTDIVNGAMKDISSSTQSTAENIQTQTTMTQDIQQSIDQTLESSEHMVQVAKQSGELNEKSLAIMNNLKSQSAVIADTNSGVASSMKALQERAEAVKGIADTIFSISSQTNLLALNASIESARAGEAGRGFAVVADEIRQLAEKTRSETESIAQILEELSQNAQDAADAVSRSIEATSAQDEMIADAAGSFNEMNHNVQSLIEEIESIDGMLTRLSDANNQIVDNISNLSATTEEVTASSIQAAELSVENLDNAEHARSQLDNVLSVSHELDKYIGRE